MNQTPDNLLIHIGYHKTASAWLQQKLFISKNDFFYPVSKNSTGHSTLAHHFIYDDDGYLLSPFNFNETRIKDELEEILKSHNNSTTKIPVISHERLSGNPHSSGFDAGKISLMLKKSFPEAKVLIVIREQKDFILSNYFQYLSIGGMNSLEKYLNTKYDGKRPFFSPAHINYLPLVTEYYRLFGQGNVLVLPYEMFSRTPVLFIDSLKSFLDINLTINEQSFSEKINTKQFLSAMVYLRFLNIFRHSTSVNGYSLFANKYTRVVANAIVNTVGNLFPTSMDVSLKERLNSTIDCWCENRYLNSNIELSKTIGIDLSQYGYSSSE